MQIADPDTCINCSHMTIERHEDYLGLENYSLGDCELGLVLPCQKFSKGEPNRVDCRACAVEYDGKQLS